MARQQACLTFYGKQIQPDPDRLRAWIAANEEIEARMILWMREWDQTCERRRRTERVWDRHSRMEVLGTDLRRKSRARSRYLAIELDNFMEKIKIPASNGGSAGYKAPVSMPGILKPNTKLVSNSRRLWLKRTSTGDKRYLGRFVLLPADMRQHGKYRWLLKHIQGPGTKVKDIEDEQSLFVPISWRDENEGYEEGPQATPESEKAESDGAPETAEDTEDGAPAPESSGFDSPGRLPFPPASMVGKRASQ